MRKLDIAAIALIALTPITMVSAAYALWGAGAPYASPLSLEGVQ